MRSKRDFPAASRTSWATAASRNGWCSTHKRNVALAGAVALLLLAFTVLRAPSTSGPNLRDFEAYWSAGVTWNAGGDAYSRAIWAAERAVPHVDTTREELLPFIGPAAFRPLWSALARLPFEAASRVWLAILALCACIVAFGSLALASRRRPPRTTIAVAALTLAFAPCMSALALGQSALVAAAAIVAAALLLERRLPAAAAFAVAAASIQPNLALPILARVRDRRSLAAIVGAAVVVAIATVAISGGAGAAFAYVRLLAAHGAAERFDLIQSTPAAIAFGFGLAPPLAHAAGVVVAVACVIAAVVVLARVRFDAVERTAFACAALPLCVPFFHEHDFIIVLLPVIVAARRARDRALALACAGTLLAAVDWLGFAQRPLAAAQQVAMSAAAALAYLALVRHRSALVTSTAIATVVFAAIVGTAATFAPAPTWPDALPVHYRAPRAFDAAGVWHDEQVRAGLEAPHPAWAMLRLLGLGGSGLLAVSFVLERRPRRARTERLHPPGTIDIAASREPIGI